jgi:hypothetical protein
MDEKFFFLLNIFYQGGLLIHKYQCWRLMMKNIQNPESKFKNNFRFYKVAGPAFLPSPTFHSTSHKKVVADNYHIPKLVKNTDMPKALKCGNRLLSTDLFE